jgi:hypothetical protein
MPSVQQLKDQRRKKPPGRKRWYTADASTVAHELFGWAMDIESANWPRRFQQLVFYRYMTGRPVNPAFHYSMGIRPASVTAFYGRGQWQAPSLNVMAQCDDVLANRVYKNRPFLQWCPTAGDFGQRIQAKKITRWCDAAFAELEIWPTVELWGADSRMFGTGWLKVDAGIDKRVTVTRLLDDEILLDEAESNLCDHPRTIGLRVFLHRDELLARATNDEQRDAINGAAPAELGLYFGNDLNTSDIITLVEAWHCGTGDNPKGRHVLAVNRCALVDEVWKQDRAPLAKLLYKQMPSGARGQGMAEQVVSLQRDVERQMAAIWENQRRYAWPHIGIESSSKILPSSLSDKSAGIYTFTGTPAKFEFPNAITADQLQNLENTIRRVRERVGISEQSAIGMQKVLTSGIAIEKQAQLDDARHVELSQHLEDGVQVIGELLVEAAKICKPNYTLPGRNVQQIKWSDLKPWNGMRPVPFPMSRLPQSMAGRQQILDTWEASGKISKQTKMRLESMPDVDGWQDLNDAVGDEIEQALDRIVEDGEYVPPEPFGLLADRLEQAQSRYLQEKVLQTPQDRLDMILQYIAATQEMIDELAPPPPGAPLGPPGPPALGPMPPAPGGFGIAAPAGPGPAPSPFPIAPALPAPAPPQ